MGRDFSGSCTVTSRNSLIHNGATIATKSESFDAEGVPPCSRRVLTAASERLLATVNFAEFLFPRRWVNRVGRLGMAAKEENWSIEEVARRLETNSLLSGRFFFVILCNQEGSLIG